MVTVDDSEPGTLRTRHAISRVALTVATVLLIAGLTLSALGLSRESVVVLGSGCAILLATPVFNVVSALLEEVRRREWPFVAAAFLVLALLAYSILEKLG
jgi:uncharacterized membrane protein